MTARKLLIWPDKKLLAVSEPIKSVNEEIKLLIRDMIETMKDEGNSAGLAAPQIGVNKRIFIANIDPKQNESNGTNGHEAFINPEIILKSGTFTWEEGCLSIPGERGKVTRSENITLKYTDINGEIKKRVAHNYLSGCFQHELDHLDGKLWIGYQSRLKQSLVKKKMLKLKNPKFQT